MDWIALVEHPEHVCCRYRLAAFRSPLAHAGHNWELNTLPRDLVRRLWLFRQLRGANVILQRKLLPGWQLVLLRRAAKRLLFDFDDAVFLRDSYSRKGLHNARRLQRFGALVRDCDAVVAGNSFLKEQAAKWAGEGRIHVIPTCVDPGRYSQADHRRQGDGVRLIWIGSSSTLKGLETVAPMLEQVGREVPSLTLQLVCDRFLHLRYLPIQATRWSEEGEAAELAGADIGISWVPDDLWSQGKCGLKVLQYMAAGLPVVTNPVGVHAQMVLHGVTGFLAQTPEQWIEAIQRLAADPDLRRRMGEAGRRRLEMDYSVAVGARRWVTLLDELRQPRAQAS